MPKPDIGATRRRPRSCAGACGTVPRLGVELDIRSSATPEGQRAIADAATPTVGETTLRETLSDDAYRRLSEALDELGLSIEPFEELEPWVVAMTISTLVWQAQGFDAAKGVDLYFLERAGDREIVELESLQEQLELFASLDGEGFLEMTLDAIDTVEQDTIDLHRAWRCGDAELLAEVAIERPRERDPEIETFVTRFLDRRNEEMADDIVDLLERGGESFVVIGAAHLVGPTGVPTLLHERGVHVEAR